MAISQKLHTKLVQKLILTPSLQQAIKLLPMSTLELSELLNQEMVENPMLEEVPTEELQPVEAAQVAVALAAAVNIGRYIEMTIPPIVTPRKPINAGSIKVNRFAIAASTSCS